MNDETAMTSPVVRRGAFSSFAIAVSFVIPASSFVI
jgi:hypothetical protein